MRKSGLVDKGQPLWASVQPPFILPVCWSVCLSESSLKISDLFHDFYKDMRQRHGHPSRPCTLGHSSGQSNSMTGSALT